MTVTVVRKQLGPSVRASAIVACATVLLLFPVSQPSMAQQRAKGAAAQERDAKASPCGKTETNPSVEGLNDVSKITEFMKLNTERSLGCVKELSARINGLLQSASEPNAGEIWDSVNKDLLTMIRENRELLTTVSGANGVVSSLTHLANAVEEEAKNVDRIHPDAAKQEQERRELKKVATDLRQNAQALARQADKLKDAVVGMESKRPQIAAQIRRKEYTKIGADVMELTKLVEQQTKAMEAMLDALKGGGGVQQ